MTSWYANELEKVAKSTRGVLVKPKSLYIKDKIYNSKRLLKGTGVVIKEDLAEAQLKLMETAIKKTSLRNLWRSRRNIFVVKGAGKYDIIALSETWLTSNVDDAEVHIANYNFVRKDRVDGDRGGGVGVYIKNSIRCEGDNCTIVLHLKCFETIAKVFVVEKRNWKCKNCTVKSKTTQSDVAVMSHEIQCLNREKQLLIALNDEMKSRNMLLEEKIASSQTYAAKTARPAQSESSSLASGLQVKHSNRILPSAGVVVKTMNASISSNEIFSDIQRNVDLNSLKLGLGGVKHIRSGVIIRCENNEAVEKLKVCVHSKLGSKYSVDKMKRFNPRIIVRKAIIANNWSDADIVANICVLNKLASHDTSNIKIVTKFKFQNSIDIVLEVSPSLRSFFIAQGFMQDRLGRGGGVGIYIRSNIRSAVLDITNYTDNLLEYLFIEYKTGQERHCLAVFYRHPKGNVLDAVGHLNQILPQVITQYENITILGDLNINFMVKNNILSNCFESYGLKQVISEPTRITETSSTLIDYLLYIYYIYYIIFITYSHYFCF
nr:unnamed protein product [Callosobruchus analis]